MEKRIAITATDRHRLMHCLYTLSKNPEESELPSIQYLRNEVMRAQIIFDPYAMPADIITMRSRVTLRNLTNQSLLNCTLVYPSECDPENGRISVLAPLGATMIGYKIGDSFEVDLPDGRTTFEVVSITYQPESAGDHYR